MSEKFRYTIGEISKEAAQSLVEKYHYSNTLPKINKKFVGFYIDNELVGVVTLGYGTRPLHTINRLFPTLTTKDYYEIGRMCMSDEMPRNSESQMLSLLVKWLKETCKEIKVLFTWADGMLGKVGYVYQASNFLYAGYSDTDIYLMDGLKIHPRQTKTLFGLENDTRKTVRPTKEQMIQYNIEQYRGRQYRYLTFLCGKAEKKRLIAECTVPLNEPNPKDKDLVWRKRDLETGKYISCGIPPYKTDSKFKKDDNFIFRQNKLKDIAEAVYEQVRESTTDGNYTMEWLDGENGVTRKELVNELSKIEGVAIVEEVGTEINIYLYTDYIKNIEEEEEYGL